jgi:hypothetical protein
MGDYTVQRAMRETKQERDAKVSREREIERIVQS